MASPTVQDIMRNPEKYRAMSEQAVDNEFAIGIAPQLNYKGPIDPNDANYIGFEGNKPKVSLMGFIGTGGEEPYMEGRVDGEKLTVPDAPKGSVNAVDKGATATTYGHEYRHKQMPDKTERTIRAYDGYNAQNEEEFREAVLMYGDHIGADSMEQAEDALIRRLEAMDSRKNDSMNDNPYWKRRGNKPKEPEIETEQGFWDAIKKDYEEDKESTRGKW